MIDRTAFVTGSTGFIGRALVSGLHARGYAVREAKQQASSGAPNEVIVGDLQAPNGNLEKPSLHGKQDRDIEQMMEELGFFEVPTI